MRKKLIIALILGAAIVILLLLPGNKTSPQAQPSPLPINIPALNPSINPQPQEKLVQLPETKTVTVFEPINFDRQQFLSFFDPIATDLKFSDLPEDIVIDKVPHLFWQNPPSFLTVNLASGGFNLDLHFPDQASPSGQVVETDSLMFAKNWLTQHALIPENTQSKSQYFINANNELMSTNNPDQADIFQFSFYPALNNLPIFTTDSFDAPIVMTVDKYGNIITVYYRLPALFFAQSPQLKTSQKPILSDQQLKDKIKAKQATIFSVVNSQNQFVSSTENLSNLNYTQIELGYSNDFSAGYFVPVFQLQGTAKLDSGESVTVTAYLPALAQ